MKPSNEIIHILSNVSTNYEAQCRKYSPGSTGVERKKEYDQILKKLSKDDSTFTNSFLEVSDFYIKHRPSGRLIQGLENALWDIFELTFPPRIIQLDSSKAKYLGFLPNFHVTLQKQEAIFNLIDNAFQSLRKPAKDYRPVSLTPR
jgi:hypothetical protein